MEAILKALEAIHEKLEGGHDKDYIGSIPSTWGAALQVTKAGLRAAHATQEGKALYCLGFAYRAVVGFGTIDYKDISKLVADAVKL